MKRVNVGLVIALAFLFSCTVQKKENQDRLASIQIIDRNGFKETISTPDRLKLYQQTDFLASQPYEKVVRMYTRDEQGKIASKLTSYHENGEIWQYLEVRNGRASGIYREWHENGTLRLDATVLEGLGDLSEEAQKSWIFDGLSRAWDNHGSLLAEIYYDKGKLQGNAIYYHPNGKVGQIIPYENNLIEGEMIQYDEKGQVIGKTPYIRGKREGISVYKGSSTQPPFSEEYHNDLLIEATYHNADGKILARIEAGNGKRPIFVDGIVRSTCEYRGGIPEGQVELFDEKGRLTNRFHILNGMKHGEEWVYYPTSEPKLYMEWYEDAIHGICRSWYPNGTLESEREIVDNKKQGVSSAWYKDGALMLIEEYENDLLLRGSYMKRGDEKPISIIESGEGTANFYDGDGFFVKRVDYKKGEPVIEH